MNGFTNLYFTNQAAFHLGRKKALSWAAGKQRFFKVERKWENEIISKEFIVFSKVALLRKRRGLLDSTRRDKNAFLSDQCKEIEEKNRMGKIRDLFKKIRDTKGTFHAKMGSIKDRNGMDPTEAEDIKKRWQEYTEELYKKDLHNPDNHDGVITHLEPDILECEVRWALESITTNKEVMEFQLNYFKY